MKNRPDFSKIKTQEEFIKYYWYKEELINICKQLNINHTGTKQELNAIIEEYFKGNFIRKRKPYAVSSSIEEATLDSPLLLCGFSFSAKFRELFSKQTGVVPFKFTADMAAAWRKVKRTKDTSFTIRDMLDVYEHRSAYARYDASFCEWNRFLKDFCQDKRNAEIKNKVKAASVLWKAVRESSLPKVYSHELLCRYERLLQEEIKTTS